MAACSRWPLVALAVTAWFAAGCTNRVVADTPRYPADDASDSFVLKDGLWLVVDAKCGVDTAAPVATWPECAQWGEVRQGRPISGSDGDDGIGLTRDANGSMPIMTVDGDPMIQELSDCPQSSVEPKQGLVRQPDHPVRFCYNGLSVLDRDPEQRVTAFVSWPVFCGPPPPKGQNITDAPWPGLKIRGDNCLAESETALRDAARHSFALVDGWELASRSQWVRGRAGE